MTEDAGERRAFDPAARSRGLIRSAFWGIVCLLAFVWWASHYRSVVEQVAEWQFLVFGRYWPSLTVVLAVALLAIPVALIVGWRRRRRLREAEQGGALAPRDRVLVAINGALRGRVFFLAVAGVAAASAVIAALTLLTLPPASGRAAVITGAETAGPVEGPARFAPGRTLGRVARLDEDVGLARRVTYVVPVRPTAGRTGPVRFFMQVERLAGPAPRFVPIRDGIIVADAFPRELIHLYRYADAPVADRPFLLARDAGWLRWRPLVLAVQLALVALLALLAAALLQRQARRLERALGRDQQA